MAGWGLTKIVTAAVALGTAAIAAKKLASNSGRLVPEDIKLDTWENNACVKCARLKLGDDEQPIKKECGGCRVENKELCLHNRHYYCGCQSCKAEHSWKCLFCRCRFCEACRYCDGTDREQTLEELSPAEIDLISSVKPVEVKVENTDDDEKAPSEDIFTILISMAERQYKNLAEMVKYDEKETAKLIREIHDIRNCLWSIRFGKDPRECSVHSSVMTSQNLDYICREPKYRAMLSEGLTRVLAEYDKGSKAE
jgi:hypothetical protein